MKFLIKNDLNLLLPSYLIDQAIEDNDDLLDMAEKKAIEVTKEWLGSRYDLDSELSTVKRLFIKHCL